MQLSFTWATHWQEPEQIHEASETLPFLLPQSAEESIFFKLGDLL